MQLVFHEVSILLYLRLRLRLRLRIRPQRLALSTDIVPQISRCYSGLRFIFRSFQYR